MKLPKILQELRYRNKLSQEKLAEKIGIHQSNISDWENGVSRPEYEHLIALADIFDVTLDELLGRDVVS